MEMEAKFKISEEEATGLKTKLSNIADSFIGDRFEVNIFYDTMRHKLEQRGEMLRVRSEKNIKSGKSVYVMTFKGKKRKAKFKTREEHEMQVSSLEQCVSIVNSLGFSEYFRFEKYRSSFEMEKCVVEIDQLPLIGFYCEIEGPSSSAIEKVQKKLGFADKKLVSKGYGQLLWEEAENKKMSAKDINFTTK